MRIGLLLLNLSYRPINDRLKAKLQGVLHTGGLEPVELGGIYGAYPRVRLADWRANSLVEAGPEESSAEEAKLRELAEETIEAFDIPPSHWESSRVVVICHKASSTVGELVNAAFLDAVNSRTTVSTVQYVGVKPDGTPLPPRVWKGVEDMVA